VNWEKLFFVGLAVFVALYLVALAIVLNDLTSP